jgi:hypothetical protein
VGNGGGTCKWRRTALASTIGYALAVNVSTGCGAQQGPASQAKVGPRCEALSASGDPESDAFDPLVDAGYASLTRGQKMLWATMELEGEVNNGGFNQYFYNTQGKNLTDAIRGFERFGARKHGALAREARRIYATDKKRIDDVRDKGTIEDFSKSYDDDPYHALDDRFFKLASPPGRAAYVKAHLGEFCVP